MPLLRLWFSLLLGVSLIAGRTAGANAESLSFTSALHEGSLPNGLRYVILPHGSTKGDISLRLIVRAGSLDERDDERGFAHFVEHMAFQGTRRFPPGSIRYFFQGLGLAFGADLNASTGYNHTFYVVDLPAGRSDKFDEALAVLRDYADGLQFPPEQITREAGVVNSERQARDNNASRIREQLVEVLYEGTPLPERNPIGLADQIERATADQLRAFYSRNYTPQRMTLLVVAPVEVAAATASIHAEFDSFSAAPEGVPPAPWINLPALTSVVPRVVIPPTMRGSNVALSAHHPRAPNTVEGHRRELIERIATAILRTRLVARRERGDQSLYGPVNADQDTDLPGPYSVVSMSIAMGATSWSDGVTFLETELRRASTVGFTQSEVDEAVAIELNAQRNRIADFSARASDRVAGELMRLIMQERNWRPPEVALADSTQALQGLTAAEVTDVLKEILPGDTLRLTLLITPDNVVKAERVAAVYRSSSNRDLKKGPAPVEELTFKYEDFGPPGAVEKRERVDDLDLTLVSFANGVRLNVRPSSYEPERFRLRIVFPQNYSDVPKDLGGLSEFAGQLLVNSNLGRHKASELERLLQLRGINRQFTMANGTPILGLTGPAAELRFALHLLTAYLADLAFDEEHYRVALSAYGSRELALRNNPVGLAINEALFHHLRQDSRVIMLPGQAFVRVPQVQVEGWLREHILRGPLEVGIVGDVTAEDAVKLAAGSLGTLKRRGPVPKRGAPLVPVKSAVRVEGTAQLPASASVSCVLWPVTLPDDAKHNAALAVAVEGFQDRLILALREVLGTSYSPDVRVHRDFVQRDLAFAAMVSTFDPAKARQMSEGCVRLAGLMAEKGLSADQFSRVREPLRIRHGQDLRDNGWWLNAVVSIAQSQPEVIEAARRHEKILDEVTLDDVNAAARVFQSSNVTVAILRPAEAKP